MGLEGRRLVVSGVWSGEWLRCPGSRSRSFQILGREVGIMQIIGKFFRFGGVSD